MYFEKIFTNPNRDNSFWCTNQRLDNALLLEVNNEMIYFNLVGKQNHVKRKHS